VHTIEVLACKTVGNLLLVLKLVGIAEWKSWHHSFLRLSPSEEWFPKIDLVAGLVLPELVYERFGALDVLIVAKEGLEEAVLRR